MAQVRIADWGESAVMDVLTLSVPRLPSAVVQHIGMGVLWGVVLAWLVLACLRGMRLKLNARKQCAVVLIVMVLSMWHGTASPSYWLGLSFQSPSLVLAGVAAYGVWTQLVPDESRQEPWTARGTVVTLLCCLGVALGWLLMLDTLAFWPRSVYALGFGAAALIAVALCVMVLGLMVARMYRPLPVGVLAVVLLVFALTRLPSGNVWDALSDPLLWAGLHLKLIRDVLTTKRAKS
jgi:hypothetical protein